MKSKDYKNCELWVMDYLCGSTLDYANSIASKYARSKVDKSDRYPRDYDLITHDKYLIYRKRMLKVLPKMADDGLLEERQSLLNNRERCYRNKLFSL